MHLRYLGPASILVGGSWLTHLALAATFGGATPTAPFQLIPNGNAKDNGCRTGGIGGINVTEPSWVPAIRRDHRKKVMEGMVMESHVTHEDFPFNHDSHDMCFFIAPDPPYVGMMSDANGTSSGVRSLEAEWETKHFPVSFWPAKGDRAWVIGRHVFDCGPPPYRTEIHPPVGAAFTQIEPFIFPGTSDPVMASKTKIYFGNQGGYYVDRVGGTDYIINVPMPTSPGPGSTPILRVTRRPSGRLPEPILTVKPVGTRQMLEIKIPLSTVADPTPRWDLYEWIPRNRAGLAQRPPRPVPMDRPTNVFQYSAEVAAAWTAGPAARIGTPGVRFMRVTFNNVKVHDASEGAVSGNGEWNMQFRANREWIQFPERSVDDGDTIQINQIADMFITDGGKVEIQANGWEDDNDGSFRVGMPPNISNIGAKNENEKLGPILVSYGAAQNYGVGTKSVRSSDGRYTLTFTIQELRKFAPKGGVLGNIGGRIGGGAVVRPPIRGSTGGGGLN